MRERETVRHTETERERVKEERDKGKNERKKCRGESQCQEIFN